MPRADTLQGALALLTLKILSRRGPLHGYAIMSAIQEISAEALRVEEGSLYPALHRIAPGSPVPSTYDKRHLVPGLEAEFVPGDSTLQVDDGSTVLICKDMDFPTTLRLDSRSSKMKIVFIPAWDFRHDAWWHGRMAILRGVENGFAVARSAKEGLLTLSDAYGRRLASAPSTRDRPVSVLGRLPLGPGRTPYTRIGDSFAWLCVLLAGILLSLALLSTPARQACQEPV